MRLNTLPRIRKRTFVRRDGTMAHKGPERVTEVKLGKETRDGSRDESSITTRESLTEGVPFRRRASAGPTSERASEACDLVRRLPGVHGQIAHRSDPMHSDQRNRPRRGQR